MGDGQMPGNIGPPLVNMKSRYTEQQMFDQIWDATKKNPNTMMPPFGKHRVLTDDQIRKIAAYVLTL
jgi:sulfur-oxidizing protein SoxX